jgi:hypothetical protein
VDGVICGHIHHATMRELDGCAYKNSGDWVESCTALVEDYQGLFQVLHWSEQRTTLLDERSASSDDKAPAPQQEGSAQKKAA